MSCVGSGELRCGASLPNYLMQWLARAAVARPWTWLLAGAALTFALGAGLPRLELRTDGATLQPEGNPVIEASESDRARFREPRHVVVLIGCDLPPASSRVACLETPESLRFVRRIHDEVEALPTTRGGAVQSIASLLRLERKDDRIALERLLERIPEDPDAFAALLERIRQHPLASGLLLSSDGRHASVFVPLAEHRTVAEGVDELEAWLEDVDAPGYELLLTGPELAEATLGRMVLWDLAVLVPAMLVVVAGLLFLTLGSATGVIVPLVEAGVVLIWTFGAMGWLGIPVTLVTTILPVVLMAMAITDEIHLLERVQAQDPSLSRAEAVLVALQEVGRPIVLTSVTTALGFLSFLSSSIAPLRAFGVLTGFGILVAMLLTFCWIPAWIVLLPERLSRRSLRVRAPALGLEWLAQAATRRPTRALAVGLLGVALAVPGIAALRVQDSWVGNFDPDSPLVRAELAFNAAFWGSYRYDLVLEGPADFFYASGGAALVERIEPLARAIPHIGGVESYLTPLREIATAMNEPLPISQLPPLAVADLAMLAEMSSDALPLRRLLAESGKAARVRLYVNSPDYARSERVHGEVSSMIDGLELPDSVSIRASGDLPVALEVVAEIVGNQLRSIGWTLASIALVLVLFYGRGVAGLRRAGVAMVPVVAATLFVLGCMGALGVPLGIATSMFASLTVGVGVDFGIHFLHRYRTERSAGSSDADALAATARKTGAALRWNALVLAIGFAVLGLSSLRPNHSLGLLLAGAMLACYVATLLLLPRLARLALAAAFALLVTGFGAPLAQAAVPCPEDKAENEDPKARLLMSEIEGELRSATQVTRMQIDTWYPEHSVLSRAAGGAPSTRILWSVTETDERETRSIYVFSSPGRLAGTTLLMRDRLASLEGDAMWLYLRAFESFSRIESSLRRRTRVPGTPLTYEDSKGFVATDKYRFGLAPPDPEAKGVAIVACPASAELARDLGYSALLLSVDPDRRLVLAIDYLDLSGSLLKRYRLEQAGGADGHFRPQEVHLEHLAEATRTTIRYEHWLPERKPAPALFQTDIEVEPFRPRIVRYLDSLGLGEVIRRELSEADASVERWKQKWGDRDTGSARKR